MVRVSLSSDAGRAHPRWGRVAAALLSLAAAERHDARAQQAPAPGAAPIPVELNKLEPLPAPGQGCRIYLVASNPDPEPIAQLRLDLVLFGTDGVIARRVALDLAPLGARKTAVRLFDLPGQLCDGVGRVLVNEVLACQLGLRSGAPPAEEPRQACTDRLQLSSRAKAELTK